MAQLINVRCCCTPGKVLGSILLNEEVTVGRSYSWLRRERAPVLDWSKADDATSKPLLRSTMQLREFITKDHRRVLAFDSNHQIIDELRKIREFEEVCLL